MKKPQHQNTNYLLYDFDKFWRFIPLHRPQKEVLKQIFFSMLPFYFQRWAAYQNWKNAQQFSNSNQKSGTSGFWYRKLYLSHQINIAKPDDLHVKPLESSKLAIVIHVYYDDIFREIIKLLDQSEFKDFTLYITSPAHLSNTIDEILSKTSFLYFRMTVENRGRDIMPFLKILPIVFEDGHQLVLKLHTKGSNHFKRKALWRNDLFEKLIGKGNLKKNIQVFSQNPHIGMLGPTGNILLMSVYYGANALAVAMLGSKLGVGKQQMQNLCFVAGSMFYARKESLVPILNLGLSDADFEAEDNQIDGTLAHAVERAFGLGLIVSELKLADSASTPEKPCCHISMNHYFTV